MLLRLHSICTLSMFSDFQILNFRNKEIPISGVHGNHYPYQFQPHYDRQHKLVASFWCRIF